jgi:L-aspartate oxidase
MTAPSFRGPIIIGTGIAGLYVALRAREKGYVPILITKSFLRESNTLYAQGGIAAAIGVRDSPKKHFRDTVEAGAGLVSHRAAWILATEAPERIADLVSLGVPFDTMDGQITMGMEAAHSMPRIAHAGGDATGMNIEETLQKRVREAGIEVREGTELRAIIPKAGKVQGVVVGGKGGEEYLDCPLVVLATGGVGRLYQESSNPAVTTGEGVAIAVRAGAVVRDMEFVQFHPTTYMRVGAPRFLITEALRGEGAVLLNSRRERFMPNYHPKAELAPRDIVARAIVMEMKRLGDACVFLDACAIPERRLRARFPTIYSFLEKEGIRMERDLIPVTPAAHYMVGGVATNLDGETTLKGLYACGEVASTGLHGANRLASNSLMEGVVFGERLALAMAREEPWKGLEGTNRSITVAPVRPKGKVAKEAPLDREELGKMLWHNVGIIREGKVLKETVERLSTEWDRRERSLGKDKFPSPLDHQILTGLLMAQGAFIREESRGGHYRTDFPKRRAEWRIHVAFDINLH